MVHFSRFMGIFDKFEYPIVQIKHQLLLLMLLKLGSWLLVRYGHLFKAYQVLKSSRISPANDFFDKKRVIRCQICKRVALTK